MSGKVRIGLKNVHYAVWNDGVGGANGSYSTPVPMPGAVSVTFDPSQNKNVFYADDIEYYVSYDDVTEDGTLEIADLPDSFYTDVLKYRYDQTTGMSYKDNKASDVEIAFLYEVSGSTTRRGIRYGMKVSEPSEKANTRKGSDEPDTITLNYSISGRDFTHTEGSGGDAVTVVEHVVKGSVKKGAAAFANFFEAVVAPGTSA